MTLPVTKSVVNQTLMHTEKIGIASLEKRKRKMTPIRNNVVIAKANVPTIKNGHVYSLDILNKIKDQAESHTSLYCSGIPSEPGKIILSDICYQPKNFRIESECLLCDMHRLKVNEHVDTQDTQIYFHVYGVGDINTENQITDFLLLGISTYSEPVYPA